MELGAISAAPPQADTAAAVVLLRRLPAAEILLLARVFTCATLSNSIGSRTICPLCSETAHAASPGRT